MKHKKPSDANSEEFEAALERAQNLRRNCFGNKIHFYVPSFAHYKSDYYCSSSNAFPSISITGSSCSLACKHCSGIVLRTMHSANSPKRLLELCEKFKDKGATGCLISGGCLPDGSVPLEKFLDTFSTIKQELGLTLVIHTGIIEEGVAPKLKKTGLDTVLVDIIGSDQTIKEIFNLDATIQDYDRTLKALQNASIPTVPHVLVGLHYGELKGEFTALEIISRYNPSAVIVIAFMPIRGTPMENVQPPAPSDIGKVLVAARLMMPTTPLVLGCMRPKGAHRAETDRLAIRSGANAIAFPSKQAIELARNLGCDISFSSTCCSQIFRDLQMGKLETLQCKRTNESNTLRQQDILSSSKADTQ